MSRTDLAAPLFPQVPPVFLELTDICNLKCPYCGNRNLTRPRGRLGRALLEKIVDDCRRNGHELKWLHGAGEPLLHDGIFDILRYINIENGLDASFATNATLLDADKARRLLDAGLRHIYISLDSIDPEVYARTRGADLATVIANIRGLAALAPADFRIQVALMRSCYQEVDEAYLARFAEVFDHRPNVVPNVINNIIQPASHNDSRTAAYTVRHCVKPFQDFTVTFDGRVCLCCVDQDAEHQLGDLNVQSISEVWLAPSTQETLRRLVLGEPGCPRVCTTACHLRPVPAPTKDADARTDRTDRIDDAREYFTRFNPAGLPYLKAALGGEREAARG
ncbi:MAG: radical SAM/SPASM domain-containing protein [Desulfovibrionaceae bacterium]